MVKCQECGMENPPDSKFCVKCGTKILPNKVIKNIGKNTNNNSTPSTNLCPNCGTPNKDNSPFCTNCGAPLNSNETPRKVINNTVNQQSNICPYCGSSIEPGVAKCKNCGEWINKPMNTNNNLDLKNLDPKTVIIGGYGFTCIGIFLTVLMLNTYILDLTGIMALDIIWVLIGIGIGFFIYKNYGNSTVDIAGFKDAQTLAIFIIIINVVLLLPWLSTLSYISGW